MSMPMVILTCTSPTSAKTACTTTMAPDDSPKRQRPPTPWPSTIFRCRLVLWTTTGTVILISSSPDTWTGRLISVEDASIFEEGVTIATLSDTRPLSDRLLQNNGHGQFTDVSSSSGISTVKGNGLAVGSTDLNGDGWPDVYVANDKTANALWINNQDGTFTESAGRLGCAHWTRRHQSSRNVRGILRSGWRWRHFGNPCLQH